MLFAKNETDGTYVRIIRIKNGEDNAASAKMLKRPSPLILDGPCRDIGRPLKPKGFAKPIPARLPSAYQTPSSRPSKPVRVRQPARPLHRAINIPLTS